MSRRSRCASGDAPRIPRSLERSMRRSLRHSMVRPRRRWRWLRVLAGGGRGLLPPNGPGGPGDRPNGGEGAGVREPRRPRPTLPAMSIALPEPYEMVQ